MQSTQHPRSDLGLTPRFIGLIAVLLGLFSCSPEDKISHLSAKNSFLIGGVLVDEASVLASSAVAIYVEEGQGICSGTLITDHLVLTAGHCVVRSRRDLTVLAAEKFHLYFGNGRIALKDPQPFQGFRAHAVASQVVLHEDFKPKAYRTLNDLALIEFDTSLPENVKPIGLDSIFRSDGKTGIQKTVLTLGFGITKNGRNSDPSILRAINLTVNEIEQNSIIEMVNTQHGTHATCGGDSGGPSFVEVDGKRYLWAVTSMGDCDQYNYVIAVSDYYEWIRQKAIATSSMK